MKAQQKRKTKRKRERVCARERKERGKRVELTKVHKLKTYDLRQLATLGTELKSKVMRWSERETEEDQDTVTTHLKVNEYFFFFFVFFFFFFCNEEQI